jgi:hypothetical protein
MRPGRDGGAAGPAPALRIALLIAVAIPLFFSFFWATTFHGDDHVFLAYARYAPHPFVAFVSDAHGGEYYRPLPMAGWWLLGHWGASRAPFAALAFLLHAGAAALTWALLRALGRRAAVAGGTAVVMLIAPQNLDAASWFSASTDLFATVFVLAALVAVVRGNQVGAAVAALAACLSKESASVLPLLALAVLHDRPWRRRFAAVAPQVAVVAAVIAARTAVLHGWGGAGDARAGFGAKLLQIAFGLAHVLTGDALAGGSGARELVVAGVGAAAIALAAFSAVRGWRAGGDRGRLLPFAFCAIATLPLLAAGWAVGSRYFYLPAVGIAWAVAESLAGGGPAARAVIVALLLVVGGVQAAQRRAEVTLNDRVVAASRRAVAAGLAKGHRVFAVMGGVKDLDLAVKEDPGLAAAGVLVLTDVPASFVIVPDALADSAAPFIARPPLPPSGAYRFGAVRVVGLARREEEPSLGEVIARFPDLRFVRLYRLPTGQIVARDVTDETR